MSTTPDFGIPLVAAGQAQQEVTHNEALIMLQVLLLGALAILNDPPATPAAGDTYVVGTAPTGDWALAANKIATYYGGSWRFVPDVDSDGTDIPMNPRHEGLEIYIRDNGSGSPTTGSRFRWNGSAWLAL